jgi:hypothetical protein
MLPNLTLPPIPEEPDMGNGDQNPEELEDAPVPAYVRSLGAKVDKLIAALEAAKLEVAEAKMKHCNCNIDSDKDKTRNMIMDVCIVSSDPEVEMGKKGAKEEDVHPALEKSEVNIPLSKICKTDASKW